MSSESDYVDEIVGDSLPSHIEIPHETFLPWHRVKKEFIRRLQWNELTARMIKRSWVSELNKTDPHWSLDAEDSSDSTPLASTPVKKRPLCCLVIPGDDLLDIRALWRDTEHSECYIRYLGFNESGSSDRTGTRVHISNNAVTSLPRVATDSKVIADRFETIAKPNSQAYRYLREYGPYHVVNLDFCGSIVPNTATDSQPYHEALHKLLMYQFAEQRSEWLLFLTTEIEPSTIHLEKFSQLCGPTKKNYTQYSDFAKAVDGLLPESAFSTDGTLIELGKLNPSQMTTLFGITLGKWLLQLCHSAHPKWTIAMRRSYSYSINKDRGVTMAAFAFALKPNINPPTDSTGISRIAVTAPQFPTELECALKLASSAGAIKDVDKELEQNSALQDELRESKANLLQSAGYSREAYLKWVEAGENT